MVTAGGTVEAIDPVRYISNRSTGKMGYAIAEELSERGAEVTLVSAPTNLNCTRSIKRIDVVSAGDMYAEAMRIFPGSDCAVMCAAVADYTPVNVSGAKIKKNTERFSLELRRTPDIAASLGRIKEGRLLVGFALESDDEEANAKSKLERKNLDFIVLNSLRDRGAGFGHDTNKVTIISHAGSEEYPLMPKADVARVIADKIEMLFADKC